MKNQTAIQKHLEWLESNLDNLDLEELVSKLKESLDTEQQQIERAYSAGSINAKQLSSEKEHAYEYYERVYNA